MKQKNNMQVLQVKKYNRIQHDKWWKACNNHEFTTQADLYTVPHISTYCFFYNGNWRATGYVAFNEKRAVLCKTKKEAIEKFNNAI